MSDPTNNGETKPKAARFGPLHVLAAIFGYTLAVILAWGLAAGAVVFGVSWAYGLPLDLCFALMICALAGAGTLAAGLDGDCESVGLFAAILVLALVGAVAAAVLFLGISLLIAGPLVALAAGIFWLMSFFEG
ncbi:MAG: hypothetical protein AAF667_13630 [Pseudomonadota bacterium]